MEYLKAFLVGGILCLIGQILIDKTKLTPARILTTYVVAGVILGALGIYESIADWGGAGATVPLTGFGYNLAKGVKEAVQENGIWGAFIGGLKASAGGIAAGALFLRLRRGGASRHGAPSFSHQSSHAGQRCACYAS